MKRKDKNAPAQAGANEGARAEETTADATPVVAPAVEAVADPAPAAEPAAPEAAPVETPAATGGVVTDQPVALVGEQPGETIMPTPVAANVIALDPPSAARRGARERARAATGAPRYAVRAAQGEATIEIYDEIGYWGITARNFVRDLKALGSVQRITVAINSPGGDVFDGIAIHNALRNHGAEIVIRVDGIAASIASVIAMAGDRIVMPSNAMMMIHDPWTIAMGNAEDFRAVAVALDAMSEAIVASYVGKSGMDPKKCRTMMREETWMTAAEAVALGFADEIAEDVRAAARFDLSAFRHAPSALLPPAAQPEANADTDAQARALEIMDLCAVAKLPHMARDLIASNVSIEVVRQRLTNARAKTDGAEIDTAIPVTPNNSPTPGNGDRPAGAISTAEIYARRNGFGQAATKAKKG